MNGRVIEVKELPHQIGALAAIGDGVRFVPEQEREEFLFTFTWNRAKQAYINQTEHHIW